MRILWLHQYFATPKGWGAVRTYEFARRFCSEGHAVDVVCCAGYDASLAGAGGEPVAVGGMRVFVSGTGYRPHMGFFRRVLSYLQFMAYALWHVLRKGGRYDVVIASSGPLTLAVPALAGRWLRGLPFVFEVIDVWPDSAIAAGVLKNPVLKWLSFKLEALAYKYAARIITCSTGMTARVEKKLRSSVVHYCESALVEEEVSGVDSPYFGIGTNELMNDRTNELTKVFTISNCCDLDEFVQDGERRRKTRERLGVREEQMVVLYTGAMGLSNAIPELVKAARATAGDDRIVWWFAGDGGRSSLVREGISSLAGAHEAVGRRQSATGNEKANEDGRRRTEDGGEPANDANCANSASRNLFFGSLPKEQVVELYLAADVNVVTFMHTPLFYENSPNKFFDGIAAGIPAVFNRTTWLEPWLKEYGCGIVCTTGDAGAEMAQQLTGLAEDAARRQRMGQGARRLAEAVFSRDKLAVEYLAVLADVKRLNV